MCRWILIPVLLLVVAQTRATPVTIDLEGNLTGWLFSTNSRFFAGSGDFSGSVNPFKMRLKYDADIVKNVTSDWLGPAVGTVTKTDYRANGVASIASFELNGIKMDLTKDTAGLNVGFWLQDNTCPYWPQCPITQDLLSVYFGASDYQNDSGPFQLTNGSLGGIFRFVMPKDTFNGLGKTHATNFEMPPYDFSSYFSQAFNYQFGANHFTEELHGSSLQGITSVRVNVPEPSSLALFCLGLLGLGLLRRKKC